MTSFYHTNYPVVYDSRRALVEQSAGNLANIYLRNIFPAMKMSWVCIPTTWGTMIFPDVSVATMGATSARMGRRFPTIALPAIIYWRSRSRIQKS